MYVNGGRIYMILNGEPLEEVDCFKYVGSQVASDAGYRRDMSRINRQERWKVC